MKSISIKPLLLLPLFLGIVNCTSQTADVYKSENLTFSAETVDKENIDQGQLVDPETGELPDFPSVVKQISPDTYQITPLVDVDPADISVKEQTISLSSGDQKPQLDLLFVIDDSNSMDPHQERLKKNMDKFVAELSALDILDYRIGVTTIYDSGRYFHPVTEFKRKQPLERNFERMGRLLPLKNQEGSATEARFVVPGMETEILAETLKVGAKPWWEYDVYKDNDGAVVVMNGANPEEDLVTYSQFIKDLILVEEAKGPRSEEMLNPMVMALFPESLLFGSNQETYRSHFPPSIEGEGIPSGLDGEAAEEAWKSFAGSYNGNFVREDAHLGVIFVTDTVDRSNISGGLTGKVAAQRLVQLKKDDNFDRISTYGVLHKNSISEGLQNAYPREWRRRHCTANNRTDDDVKGRLSYENPQELEEFLNLTRGNKKPGSNILNLCSGSDNAESSYGKNLAKIAKELFVKSVGVGTYSLQAIPVGKIKIFFKKDPEKTVLTCPEVAEGELCWVTKVSSGSRKVILRNQQKLGGDGDVAQDLVIQYDAIDPKTATKYNSNDGQ